MGPITHGTDPALKPATASSATGCSTRCSPGPGNAFRAARPTNVELPPAHPESARSPLGYAILWTLTLGVPLLIWFAPLGLDPTIQKALAITAFMIGSWMTHAQDVAISGLMGLYFFWVTGTVKFGDAFYGFS